VEGMVRVSMGSFFGCSLNLLSLQRGSSSSSSSLYLEAPGSVRLLRLSRRVWMMFLTLLQGVFRPAFFSNFVYPGSSKILSVDLLRRSVSISVGDSDRRSRGSSSTGQDSNVSELKWLFYEWLQNFRNLK